MGEVELLPLIMRWLHILAAITAVGGVIFMRLVLHPTVASNLTDEEHMRLRAPLMKRWKMFVHTCIALFLISGLYNFIVMEMPLHKGQSLYHMLFGIKFLLAFVVFFLAVALTAGGTTFAGIKAKGPTFLLLLILLAVVIVLISGYLRAMPEVTADLSAPAEISSRVLAPWGSDIG